LDAAFYQFEWLALAQLFCLEETFTARELGVVTALDADGVAVAVSPEQSIFACAGTLGMGFSWSLYFCHAVVVRAMLLGLQAAFGLAADVAAERLVVDGRPAPVLAPQRPVVFPYVDNGNALCWDQSDRQRFGAAFQFVLRSWGLAYHVETDGAYAWTIVGFVFDAGRRRLGARPDRAWRLRGAVLAFRRQGRATGDAMRRVLGHVVYHFLLWRPGLSLLAACYRFVHAHLDGIGRFDAFVLAELAFVAALIPFVEQNLAATDALDAFCSDASLRGYALHRARWTREELRAASCVEERWRFRDEKALPSPPALPAAQPADEAAYRHSFDLVMDAAVDEDERRRLDADALEQRAPLALAALRRSEAARDVESQADRIAADARAMAVATGGRAGGAVLFGGQSVPPLDDATLAPHRWARVSVGGWKKQAAIHVSESAISLAGFVAAASDQANWGKRVLGLGDNMAEVCASSVGRAKDYALNSHCRRSAGVELLTGMRRRRRYVDTGRNPSDADSRLADAGVVLPGQHFRGNAVQAHLGARAVLPRGLRSLASDGPVLFGARGRLAETYGACSPAWCAVRLTPFVGRCAFLARLGGSATRIGLD